MVDLDSRAVDLVLTTTRAVRLRLDLDREVDDRVILDCIDVAEQAPSGGNRGSRRWIVVRDQTVKDRLAELHLTAAGRWTLDARDQLAGSGHPDEKTMRSAAFLIEHLAEVPAIVIPTIIGRHDGTGRPGLFDSVIQAAWSFCLALRARGLGTAWTTALLTEDGALRELLEIPPDITPIAVFPVAWTKGTDFHPAPRRPAREITYFDHFSRIYESGPSQPPRLTDRPGTVVEIDIAAPPDRVWALVTDIDLPAAHSRELLGATWDTDTPGPAPEARFTGRNTLPRRGEWEVTCYVDVFDEGSRFGWCTTDRDRPGARWRFELEAVGDRTRLRFTLLLGPGPSGLSEIIAASPDLETRILDRRLAEHRANMQRVLDGIRTAAETA